MKRTFSAIITVLMIAALLCSCSENKETDFNSTGVDDGKATSATSSAGISQENDKTSHYEYTHAALEGCVIVSSDKLTGQCTYKTTCPVCGKTNPGQTSAYLKSGTLNKAATCQNAQCTNRGKSFDVKIETTALLIED
ncbi:MAG: hypothetical protein ACI39E_04325 [Acutalibacteraceae bacterium]